MNYPYPKAVFRYFAELSAVPRGSGNTEGIRKWCLQSAEKLGISASEDSAGNVIIRKKAAQGYEQHPPVILQGHLDMVCAKLPNCKTDMETEPPKLIWTDDYVSADGTTLGGDDGIAIAYCFALLERDDLPHPPLTVILTNDEETGMDGASGLSPEDLTGDVLINLDSEEEGILTVGCAGGVRVHLSVPFGTEAASGTKIILSLSGLTGGHSGTEIHKPLLNANTAMAKLLAEVTAPFRIVSFQGGIRDNAMPTECTAEIICKQADADSIAECICSQGKALALDFPSEPNVSISNYAELNTEKKALTVSESQAFLRFILELPNGVLAMNKQLNMPETSNNIGVVILQNGTAEIDTLIRSGITAQKDELAERISQTAEKAGGTAAKHGSYPAWEYTPGSRLEQTACRVYKKLYGKEMAVETIHAGLECGILSSKKKGLQCISIGPDLFDVHTPRERLSIASASRTWEYLTALLSEL